MAVASVPQDPPTPDRIAAAQSLAKLAESQARAKLSQLKLDEARGLLVLRADVEADAAQVAAMIRAELAKIPAALAADMPGVPGVERLAGVRINGALAHLHASKYTP